MNGNLIFQALCLPEYLLLVLSQCIKHVGRMLPTTEGPIHIDCKLNSAPWNQYNGVLFICFFFLRFYLFMRDTQRERQRHRQMEKQAPSGESDAGLDPRTLGS